MPETEDLLDEYILPIKLFPLNAGSVTRMVAASYSEDASRTRGHPQEVRLAGGRRGRADLPSSSHALPHPPVCCRESLAASRSRRAHVTSRSCSACVVLTSCSHYNMLQYFAEGL